MLILLLPLLLGSCNNSDDVQKIFTGRTWKLTYITVKNGRGWYRFPGVIDNIYNSYEPTNGSRSFIIEFTGSTEDNVINGDFNASGTATMKGTWWANGVNNDFGTSVKSSSITEPSRDTLAKYIVEGITKATSYGGDTKNLFLYYEYNGETLCIAFTPNIY